VVAAQGPGNRLYAYWRASNGQWHGPLQIGGASSTYSAPSVSIGADGQPVVAAQGPGNRLYAYWRASNGQWHGPLQIGGASSTYSAPSVSIGADGQPVVAAQGPGNRLYAYWRASNGQWHGPLQIGGAGSTFNGQQGGSGPGPGVYGDPVWLPLRESAAVNCVLNNCAGPYHGYWAIDFLDPANQPGDPIYAAGAGQVSITSQSQQCGGEGTPGNYLSVNHGGGVVTRYLHLSQILIEDGQWVDENTVLGLMGSTGYNVPCPTNHLTGESP
jgi:hypothetical protein